MSKFIDKDIYGSGFKNYFEQYLEKHFNCVIADIDELINKCGGAFNKFIKELLMEHYNSSDIDFISNQIGIDAITCDPDDMIINKNENDYHYNNYCEFVGMTGLLHKDLKTLGWEVKTQGTGVSPEYFFETVANNDSDDHYHFFPHTGKEGSAKRSKADFLVFFNFDNKYLLNPKSEFLPRDFIIVHTSSLQLNMMMVEYSEINGIKHCTTKDVQDGRNEGIYFTINSQPFVFPKTVPFLKCRFDRDIPLEFDYEHSR